MEKIITVEQHREMLRAAFEALEEKVSSEKIMELAGIAQSNISLCKNGKKGIGDVTIAKLDSAFPGWRDIQPSVEEKKEQVKLDKPTKTTNNHIEALVEQDPKKGLELKFLKMFWGMHEQDRDLLTSIANRFYSIANKGDKEASPFEGKPSPQERKRNKEKQ